MYGFQLQEEGMGYESWANGEYIVDITRVDDARWNVVTYDATGREDWVKVGVRKQEAKEAAARQMRGLGQSDDSLSSFREAASHILG